MGNMKAIKMTIAALALGGMGFAAGTANAGSVEPPGWTVGIALGGPLPEGVYFINNASAGGWRGVDDTKSTLGIDIPLLAWSTRMDASGRRARGGVVGRAYNQRRHPAVAFGGLSWLGRAGLHGIL